MLRVTSVNPDELIPVTINDPKNGHEFKIEGVATQNVDNAGLHYYWYFDWDGSSTVLDISAICQSKPTCTIALCDRPNNTKEAHTLLAVVSSAALLDGAVKPMEFPTSTVADTVQWNIDNKGSCVSVP